MTDIRDLRSIDSGADPRDFRSIDSGADPQYMLRYLDSVSALGAAKEYKNLSFELLELAPGQRVLELGCGTGDDARALGDRVGSSGRVIAVDISETAIAEAIKRSAGSTDPVEFRVGDALELEFPADWFDGARADRVFQHLEDPERALHELVRVTRPGGKIVVMDPDWGTLIVDSPDPTTTGEILRCQADGVRNCWIGRRLRAMFQNAGLTQIDVHVNVVLLTSFRLAKQLLWLSQAAEQAVDENRITATQATEWLDQLQGADRAGTFFASLNGYMVAGRKPEI